MGISVFTVLERVGRPVGPDTGPDGVVRGGRLKEDELDDRELALEGGDELGDGVRWELVLDCVFLLFVGEGLVEVPVSVFCANTLVENKDAAKTAEQNSERLSERRDDPIVTV